RLRPSHFAQRRRPPRRLRGPRDPGRARRARALGRLPGVPAVLRARALCALSFALTLSWAADARANQYEIFIDIETEEDLYDLRVADQIGDSTFQTLVELYQRGVNLNEASRSELYALPNLSYAEVDAILAYREEV